MKSLCDYDTMMSKEQRTYVGDNMVDIVSLNAESEGLEFQIDASAPDCYFKSLSDVDAVILDAENEVSKNNAEIERLTVDADAIDYTISIACGTITGIIDVLWVGKIDFTSELSKAKESINHSVVDYANRKKKGKKYGYDELSKAIAFLERNNKVPYDNGFLKKGLKGITKTNHHLMDLSHHPSLLGLVSAVIVQLFQNGIYIDKNGKWNVVAISSDKTEMLKEWIPVIISGVSLWLVNMAEESIVEKLDEYDIPKPIVKLIKLLTQVPIALEIIHVFSNWKGHLMSDIDGTYKNAGTGMGIPGLFMSMLFELSNLPIIRKTNLKEVIENKYLEGFDLRSEYAVMKILGKQAIPVIINEILVRTFFFVKRLVVEVKNNKESIDWNRVVPVGNRTIRRMITFSCATFTTIDLADAAIRAAMKPESYSNPAVFVANVLLRVNFVGDGQCIMAVGIEWGM